MRVTMSDRDQFVLDGSQFTPEILLRIDAAAAKGGATRFDINQVMQIGEACHSKLLPYMLNVPAGFRL